MKKQRIIIAALSIILCHSGWSKFSYGLLGGGTFSTYSTGVDVTFTGANESGLTPSGRFGYLMGVGTRIEEDNWSIEIDALYTSRRLAWQGNIDMIAPTDDFRYRETYALKQLEVPVIGFYHVITPKRVYRFGFGLYASYGLGKINYKVEASDTPGVVSSGSGNYSWGKIGFSRLNFGGLVAMGVDFKLTETIRFTTDLRALTTFTDIKNKINPFFSGGKIGMLGVDLMAGILF